MSFFLKKKNTIYLHISPNPQSVASFLCRSPWPHYLKNSLHVLSPFLTFYSVFKPLESALHLYHLTELIKFSVQVSVLISLNALAAFSRADHFLLLETFFYLSFHSVTLFWLSSCLISNSVYIYLLFLLTQPLNIGDLQGLIQPSFFFILSPKGDLPQLHDFKWHMY